MRTTRQNRTSAEDVCLRIAQEKRSTATDLSRRGHIRHEGESANPTKTAVLDWERQDGERAGDRTQDHLIKSQVLYQLSYALVLLLQL